MSEFQSEEEVREFVREGLNKMTHEEFTQFMHDLTAWLENRHEGPDCE